VIPGHENFKKGIGVVDMALKSVLGFFSIAVLFTSIDLFTLNKFVQVQILFQE